MRQINVWDSAQINTCSITLQNLILIDVQAKELALKANAPFTYYLHFTLKLKLQTFPSLKASLYDFLNVIPTLTTITMQQ
jgi:hypothetical protein